MIVVYSEAEPDCMQSSKCRRDNEQRLTRMLVHARYLCPSSTRHLHSPLMAKPKPDGVVSRSVHEMAIKVPDDT
jgi:hypothetical protein